MKKAETFIFLYLSIEVHTYKPLKEFTDFVTNETINEVLLRAGFSANEIDSIIVSGRGALWSGLRESVWSKFPGAEKPYLSDVEMKKVVAYGAIAWQDMDVQIDNNLEKNVRIGILTNNESKLTIIGDNYKEIDLNKNRRFRIVQVEHDNPDPDTDMKSLSKYFYNDLIPARDRSDVGWKRNNKMFVKKLEENGDFIIRFTSEENSTDIRVGDRIQVSLESLEIPWPSGYNFLLEPKKEF